MAAAVFFGAVTPGGVAIEMFIKMLATGFEFFADEADPIQIDSHGEFFILLLHLPVAGTFLCQRLMV